MTMDLALEENVKNELFSSIWKAVDGLIKPEQLVSTLNDQKGKWKQSQFESLVADILSIIDVEISSLASSSNGGVHHTTTALSSHDTSERVNLAHKRDKFYSIVNYLKPLLGDDILKERLEIETLETLKLIAKKEAFNQKLIKIKTRLFYKQQKFNLLREESEGYSKLIIELAQSKLDPKILENIQSLIGCFNLDPNRVLDIILESFENCTDMYKTFIQLLRNYKSEEDTICQIIGFKFQSLHQQQQAQLKQMAASASENDHNNNSSSNEQLVAMGSLYKVTSYLLKYKIIDLDSLTPHLYPSEQQIQQAYKDEFDSARQYAKKLTIVNLSENTGGDQSKTNNSSSGQSKTTDADDGAAAKAAQAILLSKLDNQRVGLVKCLIEVNDYPSAMKLIDKLPPWYLAMFDDVAISICKSLNTSIIDRIYQRYNCLSKKLKEKYLSAKHQHQRKDDELLEMLDLDRGSQSDNEIKDDDLFSIFITHALPILCSLGPGVAHDTILFTKLIRILISFLEQKKFANASSFMASSSNQQEQQQSGGNESTPPPSGSGTSCMTAPSLQSIIDTSHIIGTLTPHELALYNQIYTVLNEVLLPSLSMISMNPCLAIELWNLLKLFPYEMRYYLYNNWRQNTYKHFPHLIRAKAECQEKIKYLLKRLTKENVKIHGRQIGKLSHDNPIIVCDYILTQIQRYDNFILPIVDSLKFMTALSYDVLSYCIIMAISDADRDKMKHDSTSISSWLTSVATFSALAFKKYPIELTAIIQYVINQLKNRKSFDLLILQEIVQKMCGIEVLSEVNDLQLEAMSGGDLLRQEAGYFNPIRNIKKCANRLKEALADHGLILPLCILLSQQRDYIVFTDFIEQKETGNLQTEKRHLKLTGCLYDQSQDSLVQFSQFLSTTLTTEEYIHIFPKIDVLVNEYHVSPDIAFFLSRPMYAHHIQSKYEELRRMDRSTRTAEKPSKTQRYLESSDIVMQPVIDLVRTLQPAKIWEDMSPVFYTTFWTLSMSDCFVPSGAYEKQRAILKQKLNAIDDNQEMTTTKKRKEKEKILIVLEKLTEEENKQKDHVQHIKARFDKEKECWFPQKNKTKNETITVFLQLCIFSRCLFTIIDACYCAKFIQLIHSLKTPNFSTIICYDRIFSDISYSIASLTDNEARRYGRFMLGLLETVMSWHGDPVVFENECAQYPGFLTVFRNALNASSANSNKQEQLDYENYRHVCHKWHYKLTKSFIVCLESEEYIQMRNSLIILTKILPHYPKITGFCTALDKRVEKIKMTEKDKRQDLYTLALVYLGQLRQRKPMMVDESKFHLKESTSASGSLSTSSTASANKQNNSLPNGQQASGKPTQNGGKTQQTNGVADSSSSADKFKQPSRSTAGASGSSSSSSSSAGTGGSSSQQQSSSKPSASSSSSSSQQASSSSNQTSTASSSSSSNSRALTSTSGRNTVDSSSSSSSSSSKSQHSSSSGSSSQPSGSSGSSSNNSTKGSSSSTNKDSSSAQQQSSAPGSNSTNNSTVSSSGRIVHLPSSPNSYSPTSPSKNASSSSSSSSKPANSAAGGGSNATSSSSSSRQDDKRRDDYYSGSGQSTNGGGSSSSSSSSRQKRPGNASPSAGQRGDERPLTPVVNSGSGNNGNMSGYSPTSSVSSDELPSPKRMNTGSSSSYQSNHQNTPKSSSDGQQHRNSHSRSSSPKQQSSSSSSSYHGSSNNNNGGSKPSSSSTSDKNKRSKADDMTQSTNNSNGSSNSRIYQSSGQNSSNSYGNSGGGYAANNSNSDNIVGSHKRKSSRERSDRGGGDRSDRSDRGDRDSRGSGDKDRNSSDKKDHRKREHSAEPNNDAHHKRSKSDDNKKKGSGQSSSQPTLGGVGQPPQSSSVTTSSSSTYVSSSSSSSLSNSSKSRSSKKHESSMGKDDFQHSPNSMSSSHSSNTISLSSKHRSSNDDRRTSHDKGGGSHYSKDKK